MTIFYQVLIRYISLRKVKPFDKEKNSLKSKYIMGNENDNKMLALNKAGHGMHMIKSKAIHFIHTPH